MIVLPASRTEDTESPAADRPRRQAGSAKGLITVPDDFDDPIDEFELYA
ncbi:hypothetical protein [Rubrivirga sp. IMCC45206]